MGEFLLRGHRWGRILAVMTVKLYGARRFEVGAGAGWPKRGGVNPLGRVIFQMRPMVTRQVPCSVCVC